jgi:SNF2 family DNA or RNA helicase
LVVRDNFQTVEYSQTLPDATDQTVKQAPVNLPPRIKTSLKPHQIDGLNWLARCVQIGRPGALLADDMGLGKTLQAIAFMAWLREETEAGRRPKAPFLIVAPTGLLGTWRAEIERHVHAPFLGEMVPAFGGNLKSLREEDSLSQRDIDSGRAALDNEVWRDAGLVLTTYETLRDYHFSFARTRFSLVVFDEIQKLKNPASQVTRAAETMNAAFTLGMTGTPVENRLHDLWSIMDVVAPGFLGASRDFDRRYPSNDRAALAELKAKLMDGDPDCPAYMVRRLKADALEGMPEKTVHAMEVVMPPVQANVYRDVVTKAAAAAAGGTLGKGGMLSVLAAMRGISLHPPAIRAPSRKILTHTRPSPRGCPTLLRLSTISRLNARRRLSLWKTWRCRSVSSVSSVTVSNCRLRRRV